MEAYVTMDNNKRQTSFHKSIKQFALKATASAIVSFMAETALASTCDTVISTNLAGEVCDFALPTTSVTVASTGELGGISMLNYAPAPPSFISIDAGGLINATGTAITIASSTLLNGISNNGTINSATLVMDIVAGSHINGGIVNIGNINASNGTAIKVEGLSIINGGISNSGLIEIGSNNAGIVIDSSSLDGGLTNSGLIETNFGSNLVVRTTSNIYGDITNTATMRSADATGIAIASSTVHGNIANAGVISGGINGLDFKQTSQIDESVLNTGTISGGQTAILLSSSSITGSISNTGTISGGQTGILISNTSSVTGGISNSGIIRGDSQAINICSDCTVSQIDILGQSARIIGNVSAPSTPINITAGAAFTSEGDYTVSNFNISSNAVFNMANTITATSVNNSGTLALTNTLKTINGNYAQLPGGLFEIGVSNSNNYGQLAVTGGVDLTESGDIYVELSQNASLYKGAVLSDVISGGAFTTPANGFQISDNSYIWEFVPTLNQTFGLNLTTTINSEAYSVCQGSFCQGAATAILGEIAAGNATFGAYSTLSSASALQVASVQATPELTNENIQVVQLITRAVMDSMPMWDTLRGKSAGDAMIYPPGKAWMKPYGATMNQNARSTVPGFNATAYGAVVGKDIALTNDAMLGGGIAIGGDTMQGKSVLSGQSIQSQAYQGIVYGSKTFAKEIYFAGQGLVGYETNDTSRSIPLYSSVAKGSFNSWFTNIRAEAGWSTYVGSPNLVFTPEVDASYVYINQGSYQESGSSMDLAVASNNNSSFVLGAYGNGAYHLPSLHNHDLSLTGYAGVAGDVINDQPQVTSTFVASGASFSTFGIQFNGVVFRGGAGLKISSTTSPLIVELNYDLQSGNNAYSGVGAATLKYKM